MNKKSLNKLFKGISIAVLSSLLVVACQNERARKVAPADLAGKKDPQAQAAAQQLGIGGDMYYGFHDDKTSSSIFAGSITVDGILINFNSSSKDENGVPTIAQTEVKEGNKSFQIFSRCSQISCDKMGVLINVLTSTGEVEAQIWKTFTMNIALGATTAITTEQTLIFSVVQEVFSAQDLLDINLVNL